QAQVVDRLAQREPTAEDVGRHVGGERPPPWSRHETFDQKAEQEERATRQCKANFGAGPEAAVAMRVTGFGVRMLARSMSVAVMASFWLAACRAGAAAPFQLALDGLFRRDRTIKLN